MTTALSRYGVLGKLPPAVFQVLELADNFRREYCDIQQARHNQLLDLRERRFPAIFAAMTRQAAAKSLIWQIEREIKALHSEVRDRNARTDDQEQRLKAAREEAKAAFADLKAARLDWYAMVAAHKRYWHSLRDWKAVKDRAKRRTIYAEVKWPETVAEFAALPVGEKQKPLDLDRISPAAVAEYGQIIMELDLQTRNLDERYQGLGLHSTIRGEIVDASQPKERKDDPGIRYFYGRDPEPRPWKKLSIQFVGGLSLAKALGGTPQFAIRDRGNGLYDVTQQIGTAGHPKLIRYKAKLDTRIPSDSVLQRWSLNVEREKRTWRNKNGEWRETEYHRSVVVPIIAAARHKPTGSGLLAYDLTCSVRRAGIEVATLYGEHVFERVILPWRLVDQRMIVKESQLAIDRSCNDLLARRGATPETGQRQGYWALADYIAANESDWAAIEHYRDATQRMQTATRIMQRAVRSIEKLYELVAFRACQLHDTLAVDPIDLARLKRYDTRDLLRDDVIPAKAREYFQAAAPGKLAALLKGYGLAKSGDVRPNIPDDAPPTDLFTSYIANWFGQGQPAPEPAAAQG